MRGGRGGGGLPGGREEGKFLFRRYAMGTSLLSSLCAPRVGKSGEDMGGTWDEDEAEFFLKKGQTSPFFGAEFSFWRNYF